MSIYVSESDVLPSTPILLVDREDRIVAVLVGRPADVPSREPWIDTMQQARQVLRDLEDELKWGSSQTLPRPPGSNGVNCRGDYRTSSVGPSYGGGQTVSHLHLCKALANRLIETSKLFS